MQFAKVQFFAFLHQKILQKDHDQEVLNQYEVLVEVFRQVDEKQKDLAKVCRHYVEQNVYYRWF